MIRELKTKVLDLFDGPTLSQLATVNRYGRPWVRHVMSTIDQRMTLRVPTRSDTRKVRDIRHCPDVHVLVGKNLFSSNGAYAQIEGFAIVTADPRLLRREWHSTMQRYLRGVDDPNYVLIEIRPYRVEYWSALEEHNPRVLEADDLVPSDSEFDEYWMAESGTVPVLA